MVKRGPRLTETRAGAQAAALGAGFYAAGLSPSFRVRKISVEDIFPFGVSARPRRPRRRLLAGDCLLLIKVTE